MNLEIYSISTKDRLPERASVAEADDTGNFTIDSRSIDKELFIESEWAFTALQEYRRILRSEGMDVNCYGALRNVYPSPMMMKGTKAYQLTMNKPATMESVVDIFDYYNVDESSSVNSQDEFYQKWVSSL